MAALVDTVRQVRADLVVPDAFGPALDARVKSAQSTWRDVRIDPERFARHLASRLDPPVALMDQLHVEDLYLACGCIDGLPAAFEAFDTAHGAGIELVIKASGIDLAQHPDMPARVRERLIVKVGDAPPKIASFAGKGSLGSWVRIFAMREAQRLLASDPQQ